MFPLQVVINLSHPGVDHTGGEFLLYEQRPRAQSRATATLIPHGHGLVFTTRDRPVESQRGWSAAPVRHGVSVIRSGERFTPRTRLPRRRLMARTGTARPLRRLLRRTRCSARTGARTAARHPGQLGGHRRSRIYGRLDCPSARRAIAAGGYVSHRVFFADEPAAVAAGYRPCAVCLPAAYAAWLTRGSATQAQRPRLPGSGLSGAGRSR